MFTLKFNKKLNRQTHTWANRTKILIPKGHLRQKIKKKKYCKFCLLLEL